MLWSIHLAVPQLRLAAVEAALTPFAVALSTFEAGDAWTVDALTAGRPNRRLVAAALSRLGDLATAVIAPVPERDWVVASQRALPPVRAGRFFVHGSHVPRVPAGAVAILVDPGMAFGTGHHESTRGCLLALDRLAHKRRFARPLDMGCGSGILAIAMAKLWCVPVLAADNDPQAVAVARRNAGLNGVGHLVRVVRSAGYGPPVRARAPFDLVAANILARPLSRLAPGLARHLAPDGRAILAGLLKGQEAAVIAAHRRAGLDLVHRRRYGDWSVLVVGRSG